MTAAFSTAGASVRDRMLSRVRANAVPIVLCLILIVAVAVAVPSFFQVANLLNVGRQAAITESSQSA